MKKKRKRPVLFARAKTESAPEPVTETRPEGLPVRVGDTVTRRAVSFSGASEGYGARVRTGTVVYVHPLGRFHTVEFAFARGYVRESFTGVGADGTPAPAGKQGAPGVPRFRMVGDREAEC